MRTAEKSRRHSVLPLASGGEAARGGEYLFQ